MWPTILSLGPTRISTQGVILALTFFFVSFWIWKKGREEHFEEETLMDVVILTTLIGFIFSRILFVLLHLNLFTSFWQAFRLVKYPGFSWHGAFVGGLIAFYFLTKLKKWDFYVLADLIAPPLLLALALARLANFFAGSFYGRATSLFIGLIFPGQERPRHPTQLYAFFLYLVFLKLITKIEKEYRFYDWYQGSKREAAPGFVFLSLFIIVGFVQFVVAFFVDDWLYWRSIPLIFLAPILEILIGGSGIYCLSGRDLKGRAIFLKFGKGLGKLGSVSANLKAKITSRKGRLKLKTEKNEARFRVKSKQRIKVGKQV